MKITNVSLTTFLAALVMVSGFAGCGGVENSPEGAKEVIGKAFGSSEPIDEANLDLSLEYSETGKTPGQVLIAGPYKASGDGTAKFDLTVQTLASTQINQDSGSIRLVSTGEKSYAYVGDQPFAFDTKETESNKAETSLGSLGVKPSDWMLSPQMVGSEDLDGQKVVHVKSTVDVKKFGVDLDKLNKKTSDLQSGVKDQADQASGFTKSLTAAQIDLWADKSSGKLKRMVVDADTKKGPLRVVLSLDPLQSGFDPKDPDNAKPFSDLINGLKALSTQATESSSKSSNSASSGSEATGASADNSAVSGSSATGGASDVDPKLQKYVNCLSEAGTDIGKAQACVKYQP